MSKVLYFHEKYSCFMCGVLISISAKEIGPDPSPSTVTGVRVTDKT